MGLLVIIAAVVLLISFGNSSSVEPISSGTAITNIASKPYLATWVTSSNAILCVGAIVSPTLVITSAACIVSTVNIRATAGTTYIVAGIDTSTQISSSSYRYKVDYVVPYPRFGEFRGGKDVGLLFTNASISLGGSLVKAAQVPSFDPQVGLDFDVSGWSAADGGGNSELLTGKIQTVSPTTAQSLQPQVTFYQDQMFARNNITLSGGITICGGAQSGAPMVIGNYLFGIMSFQGLNCAALEIPAVLSRISQFYQWITNVQARYNGTAKGVVNYVLDSSFSVTASEQTFTVLVPRDLRSVRFTLSGGAVGGAGLRTQFEPSTSFDCISATPGVNIQTCTYLAALEGIYTVQVYPTNPSVGISGLKLEVDFEHLYGYWMVIATYNNTILKKHNQFYLSNPVIPGLAFNAWVTSYTKNTRQRLLVSSGITSAKMTSSSLLCSKYSLRNTYEPGECSLISAPDDTTSISLTIQGDLKKKSDYGLQFSYGRFISPTANGFPYRTRYSVTVPRKATKYFDQPMKPADEFGLSFVTVSGSNVVTVFFGDSDANPECVITKPPVGTTAYCSIIVPPNSGDVIVWVSSGANSAYIMTFYSDYLVQAGGDLSE